MKCGPGGDPMSGLRFVNRAAELSLPTEEAERACRSDPRFMHMSRPAGTGKSALIDNYLTSHPELTRVAVAGAEPGARVHLGVADTLLRSLAARAGHRSPLPAPASTNTERIPGILVGREELPPGSHPVPAAGSAARPTRAVLPR